MYVCCCLTGSLWIILVEEWLLTQMNDMKWFLVYEESSGRVIMTNIWGQYHVIMSWYYVIILCPCYGQAILRYTSTKWKQCGLRDVGISMDDRETLKERLLGRDNVVLDVWYYYCVYVVHVVYLVIVPMVMCTCNICSIVYIWCCVVVVYMVLYAYCLCSAGYKWCYKHIGYVVLCTYYAMYMLDMLCYVHMVLCACGALYML